MRKKVIGNPDMERPASIDMLIDCLEECSTDSTEESEPVRAEGVLEAIYEIAIADILIPNELKPKIGDLINRCIRDIDNCVFYSGFAFDIDRGPYILILRSGLQFLLEDFKDFPCGAEPLVISFDQSDIYKSAEVLDKRLQQWKKNINVIGYDNSARDFHELMPHPRIPKTHWWWFHGLNVLWE